MLKSLLKKLAESIQAIAPITLLVAVLAAILTDANALLIGSFLIGAALLILGMTFFTLGADIAMMPMGSSVGGFLAKTKKSRFYLVALCCFVIGFVVTIAEPTLMVLANQLSDTGTNYTILFAVAGGVGMLLVAAVARIFFKIKLSRLLIICYTIVFALGIALYIVNKEFFALAFDSGGVATGPMTVPFLMALGFGVCSMREGSDDDSFGVVALCAIGAVVAIMIMGLTGAATIQPPDYSQAETAQTLVGMLSMFLGGIVDSVVGVLLSLCPIIAVFFLFNIFFLRLRKQQLIKIIVGILYTFLGLSMFLAGVNVGFLPMGIYMGEQLALLNHNWVMIPVGMVFGALIVLAEPAVHVLNKQVEEVSGGAISKRAMLLFLCAGVSVSTGLCMVRVLTGISMWWFIAPVYGISLLLMFFTPPIFTGIAFDSGGVASGPMTATFLLPLCIGACEVLGGAQKIFTDGFGLVAFVAMTPLITIQLLGMAVKIKKHRLSRKAKKAVQSADIIADANLCDTIDFDSFDEEGDTIDFIVDNISHKFNEDELNDLAADPTSNQTTSNNQNKDNNQNTDNNQNISKNIDKES